MAIKPPEFRFCPFCTETLAIKIEENRERKYCPSCGWQYFPSPAIAAAAIIIREDEVLMVQRKRDPFVGTWMFPAGFVEYGEDLPETVAREVKEETGLRVQKVELFCIQQSHDDPRAPGHFVVFYQVYATGRARNKDRDENENVFWFPIEDPPEIGFPTHLLVMNMLRSEIE